MRKFLIPIALCLVLVATPATTRKAKAATLGATTSGSSCASEEIVAVSYSALAEAVCVSGTRSACSAARSQAFHYQLLFVACLGSN